jgi:hypothetical protein
MDPILAIILGLFLVLFFGTAFFGLYVWLKKSVYTREKFAFAGLAAALTLTVFVIASIFAQEPPWLATIGLIKQALGLPYQPPPPLTGEQEILSILLVFGLWWLIAHLHRQWNGAESTSQYEQRQKQQTPSLIADTRLLLHPSRNRALLAVYNPANQYRPTALEGAVESLVWHEQARDLLQLSNSRYDFPEDEWHEQAHCWIGTHAGTGDTVVLACRESQPDAAELQSLTDYAEKVRRNKGRNGNGLEFILALKDGDIDEPGQIDGYSLRTVSESRLLDGLVSFDNYFRALRERVEKDTLTGSDLTLEQVYTESRYKLDKEGDAQSGLEAFLNDWLEESGLRQIALLGEYGQGKSTASLMLSYHLMRRIQQDPRSARIPLLLELRGKSPRTLTENQLLAIWAEPYGIDPRALVKLLVAGRLLLIFEGFDEVDLVGNTDVRIAHFKNMWGLCYPKAKILVTGRPNYFLDDTELKAALGIQEPSLERPYCQAVYLAPFDFEEIEHSLRNLDTETREGIIELADENERFYDIVSRPSMLHVVSTLWHRENLAQYGERINSALVMDLFVRHSYERQGGKGQKYAFTPPTSGRAKPAFMALNIRERAYFMEGIATYMLIHGLPNQITGRELDEVVRLLIDTIPDAVSEVDAQGGETRKPLRQRYDLENNPDEIQAIFTDVRTCGLLVPDLSRNGSFKFGHKSFMEFLAGKVFAQWSLRKELEDIEEKSVSSLVNKLGLKMRHVIRQAEMIAFAVEWIAEKAKDQRQAAKLLFSLIFREYNLGTKFFSYALKIGLRCTRPLLIITHKNTRITIFKISIYAFLVAYTYSLSIIKEISSSAWLLLTFLLISIFDELFIACIQGKAYSHTRIKAIALFTTIVIAIIYLQHTTIMSFINQNLNKSQMENYFTCLSFIVVLLLISLFSVILGLSFGHWNQKPNSAWMNFRIWHAICAAAHLERPAIVSVVGEKSLRLLEDVAAKEPRPWTIAESLEKLKDRSDVE